MTMGGQAGWANKIVRLLMRLTRRLKALDASYCKAPSTAPQAPYFVLQICFKKRLPFRKSCENWLSCSFGPLPLEYAFIKGCENRISLTICWRWLPCKNMNSKKNNFTVQSTSWDMCPFQLVLASTSSGSRTKEKVPRKDKTMSRGRVSEQK